MISINSKVQRMCIIFTIIFFILFTVSSNTFAASGLDQFLEGTSKVLFNLHKTHTAIEMAGDVADGVSKLPDAASRTLGKVKTVGYKFNIIDEDSIIASANQDDVAMLEKIADANNITDPDKRETYIAETLLQYQTNFGAMGYTGAQEKAVFEMGAQEYGDKKTRLDYALLSSNIDAMIDSELNEQLYGVSNIAQEVGNKTEFQPLVDISGYTNDVAGFLTDADRFKDSSTLEKVEIADRTLDRIINFGDGKDYAGLKEKVISKIADEETFNKINNLQNSYGRYNPDTGYLDYLNPGGSGVPGNFPGTGGTGGYPNNYPGFQPPEGMSQEEYMKEIEKVYSKEDIVHIAEQIIPPDYQGVVPFVKTAVGMRWIIPGRVEVKADASPLYPLAGVQGEYTIGARTSSLIIEPGHGLFSPPKIRKAGIQKVTAEIKHNKYPTPKSSMRGLPTKNNVIEGLKYTSKPFMQNGKYKLVVEAVDEAFQSTRLDFTIEVRAKDTTLTNNKNPVRNNEEERVIKVGEAYNPDTGSSKVDGKEKRSGSFAGFEKVNETGDIGDNRRPSNKQSWTNSANSPSHYSSPNNYFGTINTGNNSEEYEDKNDNVTKKANSVKEQLNQIDEQKSGKSALDKAYERIFSTVSKNNSENKENDKNNSNLYDRFFGNNKEENNSKQTKYNNAINKDDKVLKLSPIKREESEYERDKKLVDFLKYNEEEIYNRGFNALNDTDKMVYPVIAEQYGLVTDSREFYTNNEVVDMPKGIKEKIYEEIGDEFVKSQLSVEVNGDYQSIISSTYSALNEETEKALGQIQMIFKPKQSAFGYNPNKLEIGLAFKHENNRQIQYLKVEKSANGYQVYSMDPTRSNKINKYWNKIDGFVLNEAEYSEIQKGLANQKFN
jgi:hypothetical protein